MGELAISDVIIVCTVSVCILIVIACGVYEALEDEEE